MLKLHNRAFHNHAIAQIARLCSTHTFVKCVLAVLQDRTMNKYMCISEVFEVLFHRIYSCGITFSVHVYKWSTHNTGVWTHTKRCVWTILQDKNQWTSSSPFAHTQMRIYNTQCIYTQARIYNTMHIHTRFYVCTRIARMRLIFICNLISY